MNVCACVPLSLSFALVLTAHTHARWPFGGWAEQLAALQEDVDTLRRDGEAKTRIIHDYLMRERSGQLGACLLLKAQSHLSLSYPQTPMPTHTLSPMQRATH
jgi:hypothetical protein